MPPSRSPTRSAASSPASRPSTRASTSGECSERSRALEHDDRDLARRLLPVVVVRRPLLRSELPEPLALLALRRARPRCEHVVLHLNLDVGILREVAVPARVLGRAALRRNDDVTVAVAL